MREWLTLSEAAKLLGVHPSTVRNWANDGTLPAQRTKGGHRRFRRNEIELWMQSQRTDGPSDANLVVQKALRQVRIQISEGHLEAENWYEKLDQQARTSYRHAGRALLQGLMAYLATDGDEAQAEARALGYDYASIGRRCKLTSTEATRAFLYFRNVLMESMLSVYEAASLRSPYVWGDMLRRINAFTDQILLTILSTYEAYDRGGR